MFRNFVLVVNQFSSINGDLRIFNLHLTTLVTATGETLLVLSASLFDKFQKSDRLK